MEPKDVAQLISQGIFLVIFLLVLRTALARRGAFEWSVASFFGAAVTVMALSRLPAVWPEAGRAIGTGPMIVLLLALPYLYLRSVSYITRVRRLALAVALTTCVVSSAVVLSMPAPLPGLVTGLVIAAFVGPFFGATYAVIAARRRAHGTIRRRLVAISLGSFGFGLLLLVSPASAFLGQPLIAQIGSPALLFGTATAYFVGFCLPRPLRRAWQAPDVRAYLSILATPDPRWDARDLARRIETAALEVCGLRAIVGLCEADGGLVAAEGSEVARTLLTVPAVKEALERGAPVFAKQPLAGVPADVAALLAAPLISRGRPLGVLVAYTDRAPLFAEDDLDLLRTLAQQAAVALDNVRLHDGLRQQERDLREAQRVARIGSWTWDLGTGKMTWSDELTRTLGRDPEELLRERGPFALVAPADADRVRAVVDAAIRDRQPYTVEHRVVLPDGGVRWIESRGEPVESDGVVAALRGTVQDLSDRKLAEEAQRRLATIVDSSSDAIWSTAMDGTVLSWNPAAERLFGYGAEEIIGRSIEVVVPAERRHRIAELREQVKSGGSFRQYETALQRKNGMLIEMAITISPLMGADGQITGAASIAHEISERKAAERVLAHQANHDVLTDLPNRLLFGDRLDEAIADARRRKRPVSVLMIDLDGLKPLNDELGHAAGDVVLRAVASRLSARLRSADTVARLGGDEFAVVLPDCDADEASRRAGALRTGVAEPLAIDGRIVKISASFGIATSSQDGEDADTLVRHADRAMYAAKRSGLGSVPYSAAEHGDARAEPALEGVA